MRRKAAIAATAAALAASAMPVAEATSSPVTLQPQGLGGFCIPPQDNGDYVPRTIGALGIAPAPTRPIAILDTGVDPTVSELAGRVLPGVTVVGGDPGTDPDGHGTQVAAIAAGSPGAMRGVAPAGQVLPVRIFKDDGTVTADAMAQGVAAAVNGGAGVVSLSGANAASKGDTAKVQKAVNDAFSKGVLVVAAAGNDGKTTETIPANLAHVLVAGGSGANGQKAVTSNMGPWIDVVSPSEDLFAPLPIALCNYGYGSANGTSYAAPAYAGAAAIVAQARPQLTTQQKFELLRRGATDLPPVGRDDGSGFGMLNVDAALKGSPLDKETFPEVDDDPYWVRGRNAKAHPVQLRRTKRFKGFGSLNPAKDPADVIPVRLVKNERIVVTVTAVDDSSLFELSILGPKAGDFDVSNGADKNRLIGTAGLSPGPDVELRAKSTGTYYIAVETVDPVDPEATEDSEAEPVPDTEPYNISAYKQTPKKKAKKKRRR